MCTITCNIIHKTVTLTDVSIKKIERSYICLPFLLLQLEGLKLRLLPGDDVGSPLPPKHSSRWLISKVVQY